MRSGSLGLSEAIALKRTKHRAVFVNAYLGLGEADQVFAWLERALNEKSNLMQWLAVDPMFDPLRSDPRFQDLLRRVALPALATAILT